MPAEVGRAGADSEQQLEACRRELAEALEQQARMCRFPASGSSWKSFAREGVAMDDPGCRQRVTL